MAEPITVEPDGSISLNIECLDREYTAVEITLDVNGGEFASSAVLTFRQPLIGLRLIVDPDSDNAKEASIQRMRDELERFTGMRWYPDHMSPRRS